MPAQFTSALSGPRSLAASTEAMTWSVSDHIARREHAADLLGEGLALLGLAVEVGDDDLGAEAGEVAAGGLTRPDAPPVTIALIPLISMARNCID